MPSSARPLLAKEKEIRKEFSDLFISECVRRLSSMFMGTPSYLEFMMREIAADVMLIDDSRRWEELKKTLPGA